MNFEFSEDQMFLKEQANKFLSEKCDLTVNRKVLEGDEPYDKNLWKAVVEMGWTGTAIHLSFAYGVSGINWAIGGEPVTVWFIILALVSGLVIVFNRMKKMDVIVGMIFLIYLPLFFATVGRAEDTSRYALIWAPIIATSTENYKADVTIPVYGGHISYASNPQPRLLVQIDQRKDTNIDLKKLGLRGFFDPDNNDAIIIVSSPDSFILIKLMPLMNYLQIPCIYLFLSFQHHFSM